VLYNAYNQVNKLFHTLTKYPSVSRDIAVVVDENIQAQILIDTVKSMSNNSLKSVNVFDVYQGEHLEKNKKSVALQLIFENKEKTLETQEVDQMVKRIVNALVEKHQASLRQ